MDRSIINNNDAQNRPGICAGGPVQTRYPERLDSKIYLSTISLARGTDFLFYLRGESSRNLLIMINFLLARDEKNYLFLVINETNSTLAGTN